MLGGSWSRPGRVEKGSFPSGLEPRTVYPLESRYTGHAISVTGRVKLASIL